MRRRALKLVGDVLRSGAAIQTYVAAMAEADYLANQPIRRSVEREFEIIGEALRRLSLADPAHYERIGNARRFIGFRNVLAHSYDLIDDAVVWDIVKNHLPALLQTVRVLADEESQRIP
jgi:uncharacterized protein with HEPN domain